MDEEKQREIAREGGHAAQASGHAHELTPEERSRGGQHSSGNFANRSKEEVAEIGRKGGQSRRGSRGSQSQKNEQNEEGGR